MAKLEDLIKQIPDAKLRAEIAREAAALKATKKFGLVFEEHIPEQVQLPGLPIRTGSRVIKRGDGKQVFQVLEIKGKTARLAPEQEGQEETAKLDELVVVKKFGEPIYPTLTSRANGWNALPINPGTRLSMPIISMPCNSCCIAMKAWWM
jgi:adenine-specific DNA-methyltransferase